MTRRTAISGLAFAFVIGYGKIALAQSLSQITLKIDPQNAVEYQDDIGDVSQFASTAKYHAIESAKELLRGNDRSRHRCCERSARQRNIRW